MTLLVDREDTLKSLRRRLLSSRLLCTANFKALRGSLGSLSVNKLSHIPKIQPISAVYKKNNDVAFGPVNLSSYLPLKYPTHFQSLRSDYYAKRKTNYDL